MDPDANIREQVELAERIQRRIDSEHQGVAGPALQGVIDDADRLAELVIALDGWVARGGFLPQRWRR